MRPSTHAHRAARQHLVAEHDARVGEDLFVHAVLSLRAELDAAVGDGVAHFLVVEDADDGAAALLGLADQLDHDAAVGRVQRGGGLVEQQQPRRQDEAARDVHALLLAAGEGGRRQAPQPGGQVQPREQFAHLGARRFERREVRRVVQRVGVDLGVARLGLQQPLGHHVQRRHARQHAQELAHVGDLAAAQGDQLARRGRGQVDALAVLALQPQLTRVDGVAAVQALHQRRLAAARGADQRDAFAGMHLQVHAVEHRQLQAVAQVQREGLAHALHVQDGRRDRIALHADTTDETSSCV